ncbi:hypothetical protein [Lacisediminimonas profundi]|uniref:hypothetical protein n=1 Tax=Lacisediminimonas profundi TaxID=2603856 RepID=UPI00124B5ACE|nr:hypothetical protein [Lacisediminimonas profundi]
MPFVNEYIPPDDVKKYRIEEIFRKVYPGFNGSTHWTIDRERNIYFREVQRGSGEYFYRTTNTFFWKERLIWVTLDGLNNEAAQQAEGERFGGDEPADPKGSALTFKLVHWSEDGFGFLTSELQPMRVQIIRDLREALEASHGGIGVRATRKHLPCHVTLIVGAKVS